MSSFSSSEDITIVVRALCRAAVGATVEAAEDVEELEELEIEITLGSEVFPLVGFLNSGYKLGSKAICLRRRSIVVVVSVCIN